MEGSSHCLRHTTQALRVSGKRVGSRACLHQMIPMEYHCGNVVLVPVVVVALVCLL